MFLSLNPARLHFSGYSVFCRVKESLNVDELRKDLENIQVGLVTCLRNIIMSNSGDW